MAAYRRVYDRLTAKNRDQLRNPALGNRVWATFFNPDLNNLTLTPNHNAHANRNHNRGAGVRDGSFRKGRKVSGGQTSGGINVLLCFRLYP